MSKLEFNNHLNKPLHDFIQAMPVKGADGEIRRKAACQMLRDLHSPVQIGRSIPNLDVLWSIEPAFISQINNRFCNKADTNPRIPGHFRHQAKASQENYKHEVKRILLKMLEIGSVQEITRDGNVSRAPSGYAKKGSAKQIRRMIAHMEVLQSLHCIDDLKHFKVMKFNIPYVFDHLKFLFSPTPAQRKYGPMGADENVQPNTSVAAEIIPDKIIPADSEVNQQRLVVSRPHHRYSFLAQQPPEETNRKRKLSPAGEERQSKVCKQSAVEAPEETNRKRNLSPSGEERNLKVYKSSTVEAEAPSRKRKLSPCTESRKERKH